jgi:hypothetical protein
MRRPGKSYSDAILRLLKTEGACPIAWLGLLLAHIAMMLAARVNLMAVERAAGC